MSHLSNTPNCLRLTSLVRELSQLSGVDFALVALTARSDMSTHDTYVDTCSVPLCLAPFDGRHFSIYASSGFKGHFGALVEDHLVPALVEHKQAQNLPRTVMDLTSTEALLQYLAACLYLLQQETCKNIARTWIKFIEPKKQSKYPYKRGMETAPPWWPRNVTHKEPDHLQKNERIGLLTHLLLYSNFSLESLMEATNDNKEVVPSPKRVFVEQAFEIAHVYRLLNRTQHPTDGSFNLAAYTSYEVIHVHSLTYGQNRYERKEDPVSRTSSRNSGFYRGFGTSLPTEDNRVAGASIKREYAPSSPMLSPGYPHLVHGSVSGSATPRLSMETILSRDEPPRGYFKPQFSAPEPYRAPPPVLQSSEPSSKYHHYSSHYSAAAAVAPYTSYTQQSLGAHSAYYGGYYGQQLLTETHQMRSPPSSASSANTSVEAAEECISGTSTKRPIAVDDVRPLKRSVSR